MQKLLIILVLMITTIIYSQNPCPGLSTVTHSGKTYNTVKIGNQCWFKENLNIGMMIDGLQNSKDNHLFEKYCYDNNPANCDTYGGLYQWKEAMNYATDKSQGLCPNGWHIPSASDFQILQSTIGNDGNKLKSVGQGREFGSGVNTSGFSALLAGYWDMYFEDFLQLAYKADFWSSTLTSSSVPGAERAYFLRLNDWDSAIDINGFYIEEKRSIRCVNDISTTVLEEQIQESIPTQYSLSQNYPNPFNPSSKINFTIPKSSHVTLKVYDMLGKEIATLIDKELSIGNHEVNFDGSDLTSGTYFYKIEAGDYQQTKKMILLK